MTNTDKLMEEVKRYYSDNFDYISSDQPTLSILTNIARHFTDWQKEQDNVISRKAEAERIKTQQMCYEKGQADMKRLMMQGAVEGTIVYDHEGGYATIKPNWLVGNIGDKVRVIVIPNTDEK